MLRGLREEWISSENGSVITPREVVRAPLSGKGVTEKALALDDAAIITFTRRDLLTLVEETRAQRVKAWSGRNGRLYRGVVGGEGYIRTSGLDRRWLLRMHFRSHLGKAVFHAKRWER